MHDFNDLLHSLFYSTEYVNLCFAFNFYFSPHLWCPGKVFFFCRFTHHAQYVLHIHIEHSIWHALHPCLGVAARYVFPIRFCPYAMGEITEWPLEWKTSNFRGRIRGGRLDTWQLGALLRGYSSLRFSWGCMGVSSGLENCGKSSFIPSAFRGAGDESGAIIFRISRAWSSRGCGSMRRHFFCERIKARYKSSWDCRIFRGSCVAFYASALIGLFVVTHLMPSDVSYIRV